MNRRGYLERRSSPRPKNGNGSKFQHARIEDRTSTHCESNYLQSLMSDVCEIVCVLRQGEQITGHLAWYDEHCLKVTPSNGSPSLLIPKGSLKYLYELKEDEAMKTIG